MADYVWWQDWYAIQWCNDLSHWICARRDMFNCCYEQRVFYEPIFDEV